MGFVGPKESFNNPATIRVHIHNTLIIIRTEREIVIHLKCMRSGKLDFCTQFKSSSADDEMRSGVFSGEFEEAKAVDAQVKL